MSDLLRAIHTRSKGNVCTYIVRRFYLFIGLRDELQKLGAITDT